MRLKRCLIFTLVLISAFVLGACGKDNKNPDKTTVASPLVVGYDNLSDNINPFFYNENSLDAVKMVHSPLLTITRSGMVLLDNDETYEEEFGEKIYSYNSFVNISISKDESGLSVYEITIKDDIVFSNSNEVTSDDLIFSLYVLLDKTYSGISKINQLDIVGLKNYQNNNSEFESITADEIAAEIKELSEASKDALRVFVYEKLLEKMNIIKNDFDNGSLYLSIYDYPKDAFAYLYSRDSTYDSIARSEAEVLSDIAAQYDYDYKLLPTIIYKSGDYYDYYFDEVDEIIRLSLANSRQSETVANITGIEKINEKTISIKTASFNSQDIYKFSNVFIAPLAVFGDSEIYSYSSNQFGFQRENLDSLKSKSFGLGLGAYKFVKEENNVIHFEANSRYYQGAPKVKYIQFRRVSSGELVSQLNSGTIDMIASPLLQSAINEIREKDNLILKTNSFKGYGYLGIDKSNIENDNIRNAFAMLFAAYRFKAVNNTLMEQGEIVNSFYDAESIASNNTEAYIYSEKGDVKIYDNKTLMPDKQENAVNAFIEMMTEEGYVYNANLKKFISGPKLNYKLYVDPLIPTTLDTLILQVKSVLEAKDIVLDIVYSQTEDAFISDVKDSKADFWVDYISDATSINILEKYLSSAIGYKKDQFNYFKIANLELDLLLVEYENEPQFMRRKVIRENIQILLREEAIEVPVFQRVNFVTYNINRINKSSISDNNTVYYSWIDDIYLIDVSE